MTQDIRQFQITEFLDSIDSKKLRNLIEQSANENPTPCKDHSCNHCKIQKILEDLVPDFNYWILEIMLGKITLRFFTTIFIYNFLKYLEIQQLEESFKDAETKSHP